MSPAGRYISRGGLLVGKVFNAAHETKSMQHFKMHRLERCILMMPIDFTKRKKISNWYAYPIKNQRYENVAVLHRARYYPPRHFYFLPPYRITAFYQRPCRVARYYQPIVVVNDFFIMQRTLKEGLSPDAIKQPIKNWLPDTMRV